MAVIVSRNTRGPYQDAYQRPGNANSRRSRGPVNREMICRTSMLFVADGWWAVRLRGYACRGKQFFVKSFDLSFQRGSIAVLTDIFVMDKRNTVWLRDTVMQTSRGKSAVGAFLFCVAMWAIYLENLRNSDFWIVFAKYKCIVSLHRWYIDHIFVIT